MKINHDQIKKLIDLASQIDERACCNVTLRSNTEEYEDSQVDTIAAADYIEIEIVDFDYKHDEWVLESMLRQVGIDSSDLESFDGDHLDGHLYGFKIEIEKDNA